MIKNKKKKFMLVKNCIFTSLQVIQQLQLIQNILQFHETSIFILDLSSFLSVYRYSFN